MKKLFMLISALLLLLAPLAAESAVGLELPDELVLVFRYVNPDADAVNIAGTFNGWNQTADPMVLEDGVWTYRLTVAPNANITFKYVVNGAWLGSMEGLAPSTTEDGYGGKNGVISVADLAPTGGDDSVFRSKITFGTATQIYSDSQFLTTALAANEDGSYTRGFESSVNELVAKSYWKVTADILPGVSTFLEIKAFDGKVRIYEQTPGASFDSDNIVPPAVSIEDGLENLAAVLFAPFYSLNSNSVPELGHFKAGLRTNWINFSTGYRNAKSDNPSRTTLYQSFNNGDSANDGYLEISNGAGLKEIGDLATLQGLVGLTRRAGGFGAYSWIDFIMDDLTAGIYYNTLANRMDPNQLRYYFFDARHTLGVFANAKILPDMLSLKVEALTTIDQTLDFEATKHIGGGLAGDFDLGSLFKTGFYAQWMGSDVTTLFGDDYAEDANLDTGLFKFGVSPVTQPIDLIKLGVNYNGEISHLFDGNLTNKINPYADIYLKSVIGLDVSVNGFSNMSLVGTTYDLADVGGSVTIKDIAILGSASSGYTYKTAEADTGFVKVTLADLAPVVSSVSFGYDYTAEGLTLGAAYANARFVDLAEVLPTLDVDLGWKAENITLVTRAGLTEGLSANIGAIVRLTEGSTSPFGFATGANYTMSDDWRNGDMFFQLGYDFNPYSGAFGSIEFDNNYVKNAGGAGKAFLQFGFGWEF